MRRMNFNTCVNVSILVLLLSFSTVSAQKNKGNLNTWTTKIVQRNYDNLAGCLSKVRVAKNKGFDRIVFEFDGEINSYTIYYLPSNKDAEGEKITIAGKIFMNIDLYGTPCESQIYPAGKLNLSIIQQISGGVFEGIQNYLIGIRAEKLFRVQELTKPTRLVIDFQQKKIRDYVQ